MLCVYISTSAVTPLQDMAAGIVQLRVLIHVDGCLPLLVCKQCVARYRGCVLYYCEYNGIIEKRP